MLKDKVLSGLKGAALWMGIPMLAILVALIGGLIAILITPFVKYVVLLLPVLALVGFYLGFRKGQ